MDYPFKNRFAFLVIVFSLLAFFIRWYHLGEISLWLDEALTGIVVNSTDWLSSLQSENTPVVYYFLQRALCQLMICDESGLRLLSAISGSAFIAVIMIAVRLQTDTWTALLAGVFVLISPIHIYYSQEARVYSLLLLETAGFYLLQWKIIKGEARKSHWILFGSLAVLMLHTHYFSILILGSSFLVVLSSTLLTLRSVSPWYFLIIVGSGITLLPWMLVSVFGEHSSYNDLSWIQPIWDNEHSVRLFASTVQVYLAGPARPDNILALKQYRDIIMPGYFYPLSMGLVLLFTVLFLRVALLKSKTRDLDIQSLVESAAQFALPLVALFAISYAIRPVYVVGRYDVIAYPAFLIFLAHIIRVITSDKVKNNKLDVYLACTFVVATLVAQGAVATRYFSDWPKKDHQATSDDISSLMTNGSSLVFVGRSSAVNLYYFLLSGYSKAENHCIHNTGTVINCFIFPEEFDKAPGSTARYDRMISQSFDSYEIEYILTELQGNNFWLHINQMANTGSNYAMDEVSYKLVNNLKSRGFVIQKAYPDLQLLKLARL
ncbi:glycosyltransferase family 39 protein [Pseudomonadota bacterium]